MICRHVLAAIEWPDHNDSTDVRTRCAARARPRRTVARSVPAAAFVTALLTGCTGPSLHLANPSRHTVFVDGARVYDERLPFRYYGTTRWDALPADVGGEPDWTRRPGSREVTIAPPASPLLFPFDLPLELMFWAVGATGDTTTVVELPRTDALQRAETELGKADLAATVERAHAARISR